MIDKEDFATWRAHPVTEALMKALRLLGDDARDQWLKASWVNGNIDPQLLADLRATAAAAGDIETLTVEELNDRLSDADS